MPIQPLTEEEKNRLLHLARVSLISAVQGSEKPEIDLSSLTPALREHGASFVTLTKHGGLRGCIGSLEAYRPLAIDVSEHAIDAALHDYRFPAVKPSELPSISIEISRLTPPQLLDYENADDLLAKLRVGVDGVIIRDGSRKATFLPQVWQKLPNKSAFLEHLCEKMGASPTLWRQKHLQVAIYQVEEFHE